MALQVTGRAEAHNQALLHPDQDRVMSIRENARMQVHPSLKHLFTSVVCAVHRSTGVQIGLELGSHVCFWAWACG